MRRSALPGLTLALGTTLFYLGLIVCLPIATLLTKAAGIGIEGYLHLVSSPRVLAALRLTVVCALGATAFNAVFGLAMAWALVRYEFPGRRLLDALVDLPFALPTAVAGVALTALFAKNGWFGAPLAAIGMPVAYTPLGITLAMAFTSIPFVIRTVQPVLEELDLEVEEAAQSLGANDLQICRRVILPVILPAFLAGSALAFARSLGEFGAIVFIAGNQPFRTEIVSLLTFIRLEEFDYPAAAALAVTMLVASLVLLLVVNGAQLAQERRLGHG